MTTASPPPPRDSTQGSSTAARPSAPRRGLLAGLPRGVTLGEDEFAARHRILTVLLLVHVPVLAVLGVAGGETGLMLWGQLAVVLLLLAAAEVLRSQLVRASAVGLGLMVCADVLVHVGHGLTDLHIWFFVVLAMVSLYQEWAPFLLAVAFVAVHHLTVGLLMPSTVFSDHVAQHHALLFALLHAFFLLAEATALAYGWKFTEAAEARRHAEQLRAEAQITAREAEQGEAAAAAHERAEAAERLLAQQHHGAGVADRLGQLMTAGDRVSRDVATASQVLEALQTAITDISGAAALASSTAQNADDRSRTSLQTIEQLATTMTEIDQIATVITGIAGQTNLLALNATIEAARAGDLGRGFAVVAGEVKDLAAETAQATDRIRRVVDTVRADVDRAAVAVGGIRDIIGDVVTSQATIAAAVGEQETSSHAARVAMLGASQEADQMAQDLAELAATA